MITDSFEQYATDIKKSLNAIEENMVTKEDLKNLKEEVKDDLKNLGTRLTLKIDKLGTSVADLGLSQRRLVDVLERKDLLTSQSSEHSHVISS